MGLEALSFKRPSEMFSSNRYADLQRWQGQGVATLKAGKDRRERGRWLWKEDGVGKREMSSEAQPQIQKAQ